MSKILRELIKPYSCKTLDDEIHALQEIIQEIVLLGLWRAKFYEKAAFYGGTALRILYGLKRFSEDVDFTLLASNKDFKITPYENAILKELEAFGFEAEIDRKPKEGQIETAFIKANTLIHLMKIESPFLAHKHQLIKVKIEIDKDPPLNFEVEVKQHFKPIPFSIKTVALPDLFAGKLHACLCRSERLNIKGRDWFDFLWYISNNIPVHLQHLQSRMQQSGQWEQKGELQIDGLKSLLRTKVKALDIKSAREDVAPFIENPTDLEAWSTDLFLAAIEKIHARKNILDLKGKVKIDLDLNKTRNTD